MRRIHSEKHRDYCHRRWLERLNRHMDEPDYQEEWRCQQCGNCSFFAALAGDFGLDWGVCTNRKSKFDGIVRFEHDGCEWYDSSGEWG